MAGFRYHKTFIDVVPSTPASVKRAESSPPVLKDNAVTDVKDWCFSQSEEHLKLQVSKLQYGSQHGTIGPSGFSATRQEEMLSLGSYGHPQICRRPCILFLHSTCERAGDCGFCHLPHEPKTSSLDKQQREFLKSLPAVTVLEMLLPYVRKQVEETLLPGAGALLQLVTSEISIRSGPQHRSLRCPWRLRRVLERLSLSGLVSVACSAIRGRFPKLLCNELTKLRETAKNLAEG
mmetsp:Transcript_66947/g.146726  ORF Transcript_66947/g.146726 Transcript_66947/m.146726 type:complete len:234 (+) Transcript_66947:84-785(+)